MKKPYFITSLFVLSLILFSCSKHGETTSQPTPAIVGKWAFASDSITLYTNGKLVSTDKQDTPDGSYLQFDADGSGISYYPASSPYPAYSIAITYGLSNNKLTIKYPSYTAWNIPFSAHNDVWDVLTLNDHNLGIRFVSQETTGSGTEVTTQYFYYTK